MSRGKTSDRHGLTHHPLYYTYRNIVRRCTQPTFPHYKDYGGRGIRCEWQSVTEFIRDMADSYQPGLRIERKDNNGHYCKANCRWATQKEQMNNTRRNIWVTYNKKRRTLTEWAEHLQVSYYALIRRYAQGIRSPEMLFSSKRHLRHDTIWITHRGETQTIGKWAQDLGVSYDTLRTRHRRGWTDEEVLFGRKNKIEQK